MKVLLLNQTFYPDVASTAQYLSDLAAELVRNGHDVTVVCSRRAYDMPGDRYPRREVWHGVMIRRIPCLGFGKKTRWRRAADFGSYLLNCLVHLARLPRFDLVVALTSPPLISCLGALFTQVKGGCLLFWVMDLNPDEALAAGWLRPDSWTTSCLQKMLRYSLRQAAIVVVLDRFMEQRIADKGVDRRKIVVLPPWSQDHDVSYDPGGRLSFRIEHRLHDKFVVMYSGNHSPCHPLTTLLEAARRLRDRADIAFCFVGGGSEFQAVRTFAKNNDLENVVTLPYQPLKKLSGSLSSADLHVVVMGNDYVGIVHPCKVYNIRSLGIPYLYIGPAESHVQQLAPTFSAEHGDVAEVVRIIEVAAAGGQGQRLGLGEVTDHSRSGLISGMVATLELAGSAGEPVRPGVGNGPGQGAPVCTGRTGEAN